MKTLRSVKPGETVKVAKINGEGALKRRIMDMGVTKGVESYKKNMFALLGKPGYEAQREELLKRL